MAFFSGNSLSMQFVTLFILIHKVCAAITSIKTPSEISLNKPVDITWDRDVVANEGPGPILISIGLYSHHDTSYTTVQVLECKFTYPQSTPRLRTRAFLILGYQSIWKKWHFHLDTLYLESTKPRRHLRHWNPRSNPTNCLRRRHEIYRTNTYTYTLSNFYPRKARSKQQVNNLTRQHCKHPSRHQHNRMYGIEAQAEESGYESPGH